MEIESTGANMGPNRASSMSGTHVTGEELSRLRDGRLLPAELAAVGSHAATCESCRGAIREVLPLDRMSRDLRNQLEAGHETEHLSDDQLMAHADGTLRDDTHLHECEICRAELDALIQFKSRMRPRRWVPFAIAASLAAIALTISLRDRAPDPPAAPRGTTSSNVTVSRPPPVPAATGYGRPDWDTWVADVKARRELAMPAILTELQSRESHLRGAGDGDDLRLWPDRVVVSDPQPQFRWAKRQGASYNVILRSGDELVESGVLSSPQWKPRNELKRGREYLWQVEVTVDGVRSLYPKTPAPPARFRVLDQGALAEIEDARKRFPEDALLHAVILARYGLRDEALSAVERLERSDPALAAALREALRRWPE